MAKLPKFIAQTPPPRETGLVRADPRELTDTGDAGTGALIGLGKSISGVADLGFRGLMEEKRAKEVSAKEEAAAKAKRQKLDDEIQWGKATQKVDTIFSDMADEFNRENLALQLPPPTDEQAFDRTIVEYSQKRRDETLRGAMDKANERASRVPAGFSNPDMAEKYKTWYAGQKDNYKGLIRSVVNRKLDDFQRAEFKDLVQSEAEMMDMEQVDLYLGTMVENNLVSREQAKVMRTEAEETSEQQRLLLHINNAGRTMDPEDIVAATQEIEASKIFQTEDEREFYRNELKSVLQNTKVRQEKIAVAKDDTANKALTEKMMAGTLTSTDVLKQKDNLNAANFKSWGKMAITEPARKSDLPQLAIVKNAVLDVGLGRLDKQKALKVLYANKANLSEADFIDNFDKINAAVLTEENRWLKEARDYMQDQIRTKDPISGLFSDNYAEQAINARAMMLLDKAVEDAPPGKPLQGRDILIRAHDIMIPLREETKKLREVEKDLPLQIGTGLEEAEVAEALVAEEKAITRADIDEALEIARQNLGADATNEELKAEVKRLLGE